MGCRNSDVRLAFSDSDDGVSEDGAADGDSWRHGAGNPAGPAGDPLPEKRQWRRRDRSIPLQPGGSADIGRVWRKLWVEGGLAADWLTPKPSLRPHRDGWKPDHWFTLLGGLNNFIYTQFRRWEKPLIWLFSLNLEQHHLTSQLD